MADVFNLQQILHEKCLPTHVLTLVSTKTLAMKTYSHCLVILTSLLTLNKCVVITTVILSVHIKYMNKQVWQISATLLEVQQEVPEIFNTTFQIT